MNNNIKSRDQLREVPDSNSTITLYRNQRATVLMQDLVDLNTSINEIITSPTEIADTLSIADMTAKLVDQNLKLDSAITIDVLTPDMLPTTILPTEDNYGIRKAVISSVARSQDFETTLTQNDLTTVEGTPKFVIDSDILTSENTTFGTSKVTIVPALTEVSNTTDITTSNLNFSDGKYTFQAIQENVVTTPETLLGFSKVTNTINLELPVQEVTTYNIISNAGKKLTPEATYIGFNSITIPNFMDNLDIAAPMISLVTQEETVADNVEIIEVSTNTTSTATPTVYDADTLSLGYKQVTAYNSIDTYQADVTTALSTQHKGVCEVSLVDDVVTVSDIVTAEDFTQAIAKIKTTSTNIALESITIPKNNTCSLEISEELLSACMNKGQGSFTVTPALPIDSLTVNYPNSPTYIDSLDLFMIRANSDTLKLLTPDTAIENLSIYSNLSAIGNTTCNISGFEDTYTIYHYNDLSELKLYWYIDTSTLSANYTYNFSISQYNSVTKTFDTNLTVENFEVSDCLDIIVSFNPKTGQLKLARRIETDEQTIKTESIGKVQVTMPEAGINYFYPSLTQSAIIEQNN